MREATGKLRTDKPVLKNGAAIAEAEPVELRIGDSSADILLRRKLMMR